MATGISPEAIAQAVTESVRQQFVQSGLPATAEALTGRVIVVNETPLRR